MIFFENEAAILYCFPEQHLAVTQWKGFASSGLLHEVLDKALALTGTYDIYYWLNDNRKMKVIRPADQEYINTEWLQQFISRSKIRRSATIESDDIFNKISVENIMRAADGLIPFDTGTFATHEEAVKWLGVNVKEEELAA